MAIAMTASCGCRLLETGYGDDNIVVRSSADAVSATASAAKSTVAWAGAKVMSFGDDLDEDRQKLFISIGEHAAAAYRGHPRPSRPPRRIPPSFASRVRETCAPRATLQLRARDGVRRRRGRRRLRRAALPRREGRHDSRRLQGIQRPRRGRTLDAGLGCRRPARRWRNAETVSARLGNTLCRQARVPRLQARRRRPLPRRRNRRVFDDQPSEPTFSAPPTTRREFQA